MMIRTRLLFAVMALPAVLFAAERSLVPDTPSTVPDYYCTWCAQGYACSYTNASEQADMMVEASLFGTGPNQNWLGFHPDARADLTFLLDDAFDFPLKGGHNHPIRGSVELDDARFPSYRGTPAQRLAKLSKDVKAKAWRDLGLWICNSRPNMDSLPIDSDTYWCERLAWCQQAGIANWKVDWGIGVPGKPLWKFKVTPKARAAAPDIWIEFNTQGDLYRTYDVHVTVSIAETIRRIAAFLERKDPSDRRIINCEDEVFIGAGLGCTYGVMRHPMVDNLPSSKPDSFHPKEFRDIKRRMDEVTRAVRWHRIAHPIYKGDAFVIDPNQLTDFKCKPAPARIARGGLPLPEVRMPEGKEPPYVLCARHADGEIAIATIGRKFNENNRAVLAFPLADVSLDIGPLNRPIGIFGEYASLTLVTPSDLKGKRILAQDLAGNTPVDITTDVKLTGGKLTIPGAVIDRVGRMAAKPGDVSDPGLVLVVERLTQFVPKQPMRPGTPQSPGKAKATDSAAQNIRDARPARTDRAETKQSPIIKGVDPAESRQMLQSPDGNVKVEIALKDGRPHWNISFKNNKVVADGLLGVELSSDDFAGGYILTGAEGASGDSTWNALWGNLSQVRDHYHQLTLKLQETGGKHRLLNIILRAYDEGVAVRYEFPQQLDLSEVTVKNRLTEFRFTDNHVIYHNRDYSYGNMKINDLVKKSECNVTVDIGRGSFVSLTDADRSDYSMVSWKARKEVPNTICGGAPPARGKTPFKTSWEVMIIGETLGKLYENRFIVDNLNPPCAIADTSWLRPGKAICQIRNAQMVTGELKKLLEFASANGFEYMEIDHSWNGAETKWTQAEIETFDKNKKEFWDKHPEWRRNVVGNPMVPAKGYVPFRPNSFSGGNLVDLDMPALTAYGKSLNPPVGVCVYVRSALFKEFGGEHAIEDVFAAYEKMGIAGVKPGFTPSVSQENERAIASMVKKAADHKLICVIHDAYYPYGLSRTYPNLMNIEGGAGDEAEHSVPPELKSVHDVMLTFTRCLMGPFDYTPEIGRKSKTHCHQAAMLGVWYGRHSVRGGTRQWAPGGECSGGEVEFVRKIPVFFDEMKVTAQANEYVTVARRRGGTWFVASMSGAKAPSYPYPLSFLTPGKKYNAIIFSDTPGKQVATRSVQVVDVRTVIRIAMEPSGGHLMIIQEANQ